MEIGFAALSGATFEITFGLLLVLTELHVLCIARLFGFMAHRMGKGRYEP